MIIKVIIIEQNPIVRSLSELDFLKNQVLSFEILQTFTNQMGVFNGRDLGLKQLTCN